jgi:hypothetical protein
VIVELEFLEQIVDCDWPLSRSIGLVTSQGKDGWVVLARHWQDGNIEIVAPDGSVVSDWQVREVFRTRDADQVGLCVRLTDRGACLI